MFAVLNYNETLILKYVQVKDFRTQQQVLVPVARYTPQGLLVWTLGGGGEGRGALVIVITD